MVIANSFQLVLRSWRMVLWLYGVNFLLGLLVLLPAYATLRREMGPSLEYLNMLNGFDFTVYSDFRHNHGAAVDPLLTVGFWLGITYMLISVFFTGGMLLQLTVAADRRQPFRLSRFLAASVQGFGQFFRLFLCVSGFCLLLTFFFLLAGGLSGLMLSEHLNEEGLSYFTLAYLLLFSLSIFFVLCVSDYAKIFLFWKGETRAFLAFRKAVRFVAANVWVRFGYYLMLLGFHVACFGFYFLIDSLFVTNNWAGIAFLFLIQQLLIFLRVFQKVWTLATAAEVIRVQKKVTAF